MLHVTIRVVSKSSDCALSCGAVVLSDVKADFSREGALRQGRVRPICALRTVEGTSVRFPTACSYRTHILDQGQRVLNVNIGQERNHSTTDQSDGSMNENQ